MDADDTAGERKSGTGDKKWKKDRTDGASVGERYRSQVHAENVVLRRRPKTRSRHAAVQHVLSSKSTFVRCRPDAIASSAVTPSFTAKRCQRRARAAA